MAEELPHVIQFRNSIEPDAPAVTAEAEISMARREDGGLKEPLDLPSPTLVFRVPESEPVVGYTAVIEAQANVPQLVPGAAVRAIVRFVGVPATEIWEGRRFRYGTDETSEPPPCRN